MSAHSFPPWWSLSICAAFCIRRRLCQACWRLGCGSVYQELDAARHRLLVLSRRCSQLVTIQLAPLGYLLTIVSSWLFLWLFPISQPAPYLVWLWLSFLHLWAASNTFWISSRGMYAEFTPEAEMSSWNQDAFGCVAYYPLQCISYSNLCCLPGLSIDFSFHILLWSYQIHFSLCSLPKSDSSSVPSTPPSYSLYDPSSNILVVHHYWTLVCLPVSRCCSFWGFYLICLLMFHNDWWLCPFGSYPQQIAAMADWKTLFLGHISSEETYPFDNWCSQCRCLAVSSHQQIIWQNMDSLWSYRESSWSLSSSCSCSSCHTSQNQMVLLATQFLLCSMLSMTSAACFEFEWFS